MTKLYIPLCLLVAAAACGSAVSSTAPLADTGARLGRIVCTDDGGTKVHTPRIRARRDGVSILIDNRGDAPEIFFQQSGVNGGHGGPIRGRTRRWVLPDAPGRWEVVCLEKGETFPYSMDGDPRVATYEIVDPEDFWVELDPECKPVEQADRWFSQGTPVEEIEAWVRDEFDLEAGERVRPGYPGTQWKGDPWVIADDDETFAAFHAYPHRRGGPLHAKAEGC